MKELFFRIARFIPALIITASLFVPVVTQLTGYRKVDSEMFRMQELRDQAVFEMPEHFSFNSFKKLPKQFDSWFKDNFGLRSDLISAYAETLYHIFNRSMDPEKVIIGKKGFLFLGDSSENVMRQSTANLNFNDYQLDVFIKSLMNMKSYLEKRNIAFFFVVAPNKHSIYHEYLPDRFLRLRTEAHADSYSQIVDRLRNTDINFIDLRSPLAESRKKYGDIVYYRTDSHWSNLGAYVAYRSIMDGIKRWKPGLNIDEMKDFQVASYLEGYDLSRMTKLIHLGDSYVNVSFENGSDPFQLTDLKAASGRESHSNDDEFIETFEYMTVNSPESRNPESLIVYRDSFFNAISPMLSRNFRQTTYISNDEIGRSDFSIRNMVEKCHPDIVILEIAERFLIYKFALPFRVDRLLDRPGFESIFSSDQPSIVEWNGHQISENILSRSNNVQDISDDGNNMLIKSSGEDPFIELKKIDELKDAGGIIFRIDMDSPENGDTMQFFYQTEDLPFFVEANSLRFTLNKGSNVIYGMVNRKNLNGVLRIDPGSSKGRYSIKRLAIKSYPG